MERVNIIHQGVKTEHRDGEHNTSGVSTRYGEGEHNISEGKDIM